MKVLAISSLLTTGVIGSLGGAYYSTQETILDNVKIKILTKSASKAWGKLEKKLESSDPKSDEFKKIKDKKTELKDFCESKKSYKYKSWFYENEKILNDFKNYCTINFLQMIDENKSFNLSLEDESNQDKSSIENKFNSLKSDSNLTGKFVDLKVEESEGTTSKTWKDLLTLCSEMYKEYLDDESNKDWTMTEKFCTKQ